MMTVSQPPRNETEFQKTSLLAPTEEVTITIGKPIRGNTARMNLTMNSFANRRGKRNAQQLQADADMGDIMLHWDEFEENVKRVLNKEANMPIAKRQILESLLKEYRESNM